MQTLLDLQERPSVIIDENYQIIAANAAYTDSYGVSPDNVIGRKCHDVSHHSPLPCHEHGEQCPHKEVFASSKPCEALHTHYDAENRADHVRINAYPVTDSEGRRYIMEVFQRLLHSDDLSCADMKMIGRSPAFLACFDNMSLAARSDAPILIYGESGTGKELAAEFVHQQSKRSSKPYVALNCAAISESLFESELFGHERGAFTGCVGLKKGLFELANQGTLFLDELGELPLAMQAKLLRVLDSGEFRRLGGEKVHKVDVRIIAATNRNLLERIDRGEFREDLYFRIAGMRVSIPPLRERRSDIPALSDALLRRMSHPKKYILDQSALDVLYNYGYPGNIRELRSILQNAMSKCDGDIIRAEHLNIETSMPSSTPEPLVPRDSATAHTPLPTMDEVEAQMIRQLLQQHKGNRSAVAYTLGVSERTIYRKMKRYGLSD
jgi:transcriptional regulator with PAS, ATPase and Fis domain